MPPRLAGRGIVVTGATGMAAAVARLAAGEGARLFVVSLQAEDCRRLCERIAAEGGEARWAAVDLREEVAAEEAIAAAAGFLGRIDGLCAVAGGSGRPFGDGPLHEVPLQGWEETLRLDGHPLFLAARQALQRMLQQTPDEQGIRGALVLVGSVLAHHPAPRLFATHAYAAAKGVAATLTTTLAAYYAPHRIRVNAVEPGLVRTPMSRRAAGDPQTMDYARRKQPLAGGMLEPEEVAEAALFLLSPQAARITGQRLAVDGGWGVSEPVV